LTGRYRVDRIGYCHGYRQIVTRATLTCPRLAATFVVRTTALAGLVTFRGEHWLITIQCRQRFLVAVAGVLRAVVAFAAFIARLVVGTGFVRAARTFTVAVAATTTTTTSLATGSVAAVFIITFGWCAVGNHGGSRRLVALFLAWFVAFTTALTTFSTTLTSTLAAITTVVAGFVTPVTIIAAATVRFGGNGFCWFRCFFFVGRARAEQARNG
jgi:hypothetical protein